MKEGQDSPTFQEAPDAPQTHQVDSYEFVDYIHDMDGLAAKTSAAVQRRDNEEVHRLVNNQLRLSVSFPEFFRLYIVPIE
jgi:hypothetical protein